MFYYQHLFNIILAIVIFFHTSYFAKHFIKMVPPCRLFRFFFFFFFFCLHFIMTTFYIIFTPFSFISVRILELAVIVALDSLKIFEILLSNLLHVKYFFPFLNIMPYDSLLYYQLYHSSQCKNCLYLFE